MARFSASFRQASGSATGTIIGDIRSTSTDRLYVVEIGVFATTAVASGVGIIRPNAVGTASATVAGQALDPADPAGTGVLGTAWSSGPTIAGTPIYLRRLSLPAAVGAGAIWNFDGHPIVIPISSSLLLWNHSGATGSPLDWYAVWDE